MSNDRCGGVPGPAGGKAARISYKKVVRKYFLKTLRSVNSGGVAATSYGAAADCLPGGSMSDERTSGGVRYSIPIPLLRFREFRTSFMSEYRSSRKLKVGPAGNRTSLKVGDFCVREKARRCVT